MYSTKSGISIKPIKDESTGCDVSGSMLQKSFIYGVIGSPGSGKSTLIETLITSKELYYLKFHKVIFITPSSFAGFELTDDNWYPTLNLTWIFNKIEEQENKYVDGKKRQILLVLDDCISDIKANQNNSSLVKLFFNRRHLFPHVEVQIILTSQQWTMIPLRFRTILTGIFLFKTNKTQWISISKEIILESIRNLTSILDKIWKKPHDCLYINNETESCYHNFDKLLI